MQFEKENDPATRRESPLLKFALELGPLAVFFLANQHYDIFVATGAFMVAMLISLVVSYTLTRRLAVMPLVTGAVVLVFGGLTLWLHDETFIKMKPTIVNGLFAAVLLGGLLFGKSLLAYVFDAAFRLDAEGWRRLTFRWGVFFIVLAVLNEVVWRTQTTDFWVGFKVWGMMPITMIFALSQMRLIMRHALPEPGQP